ncbi:lytic murein transglycosylase B [Azoarcus indigens]|uniref:Membrane-bound lytic murein transglycosylase B n=1 Tax=Azoarcus indigens TaxID=29545 RepID=A0A4R6DXW0_9RHOO|nr:lytic murein transglycosylase B [Azoarcus indigens]NMG64321.1 lytic murein transglycosylase B [Azoarcus indigens]TDN49228.1 membrane-bound lytic murein transglycosylase B [Azoarcus indigens]
MTLQRFLAASLLALSPFAAQADFSANEDAQRFVAEMVEKHGFDRNEVETVLGRAVMDPQVIKLILPPTKPGVRSWQRYRSRFIEPVRIEGGLAFWRDNEEALERAVTRYGVPAEVIVAIIGVETVYGRHTGNFEAVSALATLAFGYPPRAQLFRRELEQLFLLAREQGRSADSYYGSYAGALGYPQFLPSSIRNYAVDFDGDGHIDFDSTPADAIGSVAHYLQVHGWEAGAEIASRAKLSAQTDAASLVAAGIEPSLTPATLVQAGVSVSGNRSIPAPATLVDLETPGAATEYWLGYRNFYVITRYNKSSFYAMSVFQLAEALRNRRSTTTLSSARAD